MRTVSCVSAALLALTAAMPSSAQGLTEKQFLDDALTDHPRIAAAEADLAVESGTRRQAGVVSNPELDWEREDLGSVVRQDTWKLSWRLPLDGRKHRIAGADAAVAASEAMVDATRLDVRLELRELFAAWYLAGEREQVLNDHLDTTRQLTAWLRARADQGEAAGVEARRLELEVEVLSRQLAEANAETRARKAATATWSDLVVGGSQPERPALAPPPASVDLSDRPDLAALELEVAEAEARQRVTKRVLAPPEVTLGWLDLRDDTRSFDGPVFGLTWPMPLFDRNQGNRDASTAEVDRARAELEAARRGAQQLADAALASYAALYGAVAPGTTSRKVEGDVVGSLLAAFAAGEASLTDVLDGVRTTIDVQLARLDTLAAALAAERQLEAALGRPILPGGTS
jgi:cobalt-zinc-cadmium efflux system outer membrane protein